MKEEKKQVFTIEDVLAAIATDDLQRATKVCRKAGLKPRDFPELQLKHKNIECGCAHIGDEEHVH